MKVVCLLKDMEFLWKNEIISFKVMNYKIGSCTQPRYTKKLNCVVSQLYQNKAIIRNIPGVLHMPSVKMKC